jgi:hypothetical protein
MISDTRHTARRARDVVLGGTCQHTFRAILPPERHAPAGEADERFRAEWDQGETGARRGASAIHRTLRNGAGRATRIEATEVNWRDTPGVAGVENDRLSMGVYVHTGELDVFKSKVGSRESKVRGGSPR